MRSPNRLDNLYAELHQIHKRYVPDWRFGQFISNFLSWWNFETGKSDIWYEEDDEWIKHIRKYGEVIKPSKGYKDEV